MKKYCKNLYKALVGKSSSGQVDELVRPWMQLSVAEARKHNVCRVCLQGVWIIELGNPLILDFGDEFAHRACLRAVWA